MNAPGHEDCSPLTVSSPDLPGGRFPRAFTCDGANRLPRLEWSSPPAGTRELAIEMLDPDAPGGTFTHWLVYGLPPGLSSLTAVPAGAAEGVNDFGRRGYGGPCPPRGAAHHLPLRGPCAGHQAGSGGRSDTVRSGITHQRSRARQGRTGRHLPARLTGPAPPGAQNGAFCCACDIQSPSRAPMAARTLRQMGGFGERKPRAKTKAPLARP
jgi:hypothetical protein